MPLQMVKAASWMTVAPACFMCEPETEMGSHSGAALRQCSIMSVVSLTAASIGRNCVPRATYSLIGSFCSCTMQSPVGVPRFSYSASSQAQTMGPMALAVEKM